MKVNNRGDIKMNTKAKRYYMIRGTNQFNETCGQDLKTNLATAIRRAKEAQVNGLHNVMVYSQGMESISI